MKRYKANSNLELEIISAKSVFNAVEKKGEGIHDDGLNIYLMRNEKDEKRYRCDTGKGVFEIVKLNGEKEYELLNRDWMCAEGTIYRYTSLSTTYNGYPFLPINEAFDIVNNLIVNNSN